jgi:hypothetical protein
MYLRRLEIKRTENGMPATAGMTVVFAGISFTTFTVTPAQAGVPFGFSVSQSGFSADC